LFGQRRRKKGNGKEKTVFWTSLVACHRPTDSQAISNSGKSPKKARGKIVNCWLQRGTGG